MIYLATAWKGDDWQTLADITTKNFYRYASKHGYGFAYWDGDYGSQENYLFQRMDFMRHLLTKTEDLEYLWMLDVDNLIMDQSIKIESLLDDTHALFIAKDINGINGGSLVLRKCDLAIEWCNALLNLSKTAQGENHAMILLDEGTDRRFHDGTKFVPEINRIPYERYPDYGRQDHPSQWESNGFVCHLPGMTPDRRVEIFREMAK